MCVYVCVCLCDVMCTNTYASQSGNGLLEDVTDVVEVNFFFNFFTVKVRETY